MSRGCFQKGLTEEERHALYVGGIIQWAGGPDRIKERKEKAGMEQVFILLLEPLGWQHAASHFCLYAFPSTIDCAPQTVSQNNPFLLQVASSNKSELWQLAWRWEGVPGKSLCSSTLLKLLRMRKKNIYRYFGYIHVSDLQTVFCCLPGVQVKLSGYHLWGCPCLWYPSIQFYATFSVRMGRRAFSHPVCSHIISKSKKSRQVVWTCQTLMLRACDILACFTVPTKKATLLSFLGKTNSHM